ncbi:sialic acid-binding Ig-like lectin 14 isoform X3 [Macrotis lagotis]|uniref:sialic acid-binding Ig-like lectin 14 isoform X3 n=1 Tax=Macrotis lagotis TaxID=92651 RepID=UPI003D699E48
MMLLLLLPLLWDGSLSLEWTLKVQPLVTVQEGMCAHIPCSFNFPSSYVHDKIYGSWFREGLHGGQGSAVVTNDPDENVNEQNRGRFHLLGDPRKHNCSLSITDAQLTDTGKYYFRFRGPDSYSFTDNKLYVNVTDVPKMFNPTCSWGKEGLFCTCAGQAEPAPSVGWWIEGKFVEGNSSSNTFQVMSIKSGSWTNSSLNVKVQPGHNLIPYCEVRPQHKEDSFSVQLMPVFSTQENSSWPLIITLLRGALIAVGFLLTYSITWLYYTRPRLFHYWAYDSISRPFPACSPSCCPSRILSPRSEHSSPDVDNQSQATWTIPSFIPGHGSLLMQSNIELVYWAAMFLN